jgi:hypothetical protein
MPGADAQRQNENPFRVHVNQKTEARSQESEYTSPLSLLPMAGYQGSVYARISIFCLLTPDFFSSFKSSNQQHGIEPAEGKGI